MTRAWVVQGGGVNKTEWEREGGRMRGTVLCSMRVANLWLTLECNHIHLKNCITFGLVLNSFNAFLLLFAWLLLFHKWSNCCCEMANNSNNKWSPLGGLHECCVARSRGQNVMKQKQIVHNYYGMSIGKHKFTHTHTYINTFVFVCGSNWPVTCVARMNISRKRIFDSRRAHPLALVAPAKCGNQRIIVLPCAIQCAGPDPHGQQTVQLASVFVCVSLCVCVCALCLFHCSLLSFSALFSHFSCSSSHNPNQTTWPSWQFTICTAVRANNLSSFSTRCPITLWTARCLVKHIINTKFDCLCRDGTQRSSRAPPGALHACT